MIKLLLAAGLLGSTLLASAALAQTAPAAPAQPPAANPSGMNFMTRLEAGQMLFSDIMDEDVVGPDDKDIGDLEDLVLDRNGRIVGVVLEVDEGLGDRTVALPLSAFQLNVRNTATTGSVQGSGQAASAAQDDDDRRIVLTVPVDQLKSAPEFEEDDD
jgi:sporulation protein YlmC with PRC-barrel domain